VNPILEHEGVMAMARAWTIRAKDGAPDSGSGASFSPDIHLEQNFAGK